MKLNTVDTMTKEIETRLNELKIKNTLGVRDGLTKDPILGLVIDSEKANERYGTLVRCGGDNELVMKVNTSEKSVAREKILPMYTKEKLENNEILDLEPDYVFKLLGLTRKSSVPENLKTYIRKRALFFHPDHLPRNNDIIKANGTFNFTILRDYFSELEDNAYPPLKNLFDAIFQIQAPTINLFIKRNTNSLVVEWDTKISEEREANLLDQIKKLKGKEVEQDNNNKNGKTAYQIDITTFKIKK